MEGFDHLSRMAVKRPENPVPVVEPVETTDAYCHALLIAGLIMPPQAGKVVVADWDFEGAKTFAAPAQWPQSSAARVTLKTAHTFTRPGTYFPTLRVAGQRQGDLTTPYARIPNLARVRVVVK